MKRSSSASRRRPGARLVIRAIEFNDPEDWVRSPSNFDALVHGLELSGLPADSVTARSVMGGSGTIEAWPDLARWLAKTGPGVYDVEPAKADLPFKVKLNVTDVSLGLECDLPVEGDSIAVPRNVLNRLLEELHRGYCRRARVGPVLAITLRNITYERPRPPRDSPYWPAGAITLAACQRLFHGTVAEGRVRFASLRSRPLPAGLNRRQSEDLLILETRALGGSALAEQRTVLERWIGEAMQLSRDEDFDEHGDKRIMIWDREKIADLGFYDPVAKVVFKAAPELTDDVLDSGTLDLVDRVLQLNTLPDGREVLGKRVVFVARPAALKWLDWVKERGGSVAYLGNDGDLWDPAPERS
jgi:hypothetical protein